MTLAIAGRIPGSAARQIAFSALWLQFAVVVRFIAGGGSASIPAALIFAISLGAGLRVRHWTPGPIRTASIGWGAAGAAVLIFCPLIFHKTALTAEIPQPVTLWLAVTACVAGAEELFLRGLLFDELSRSSSPAIAVMIAAVIFALIHVPLYGLGALPLDLAVGIFLGTLRIQTGSAYAPAIAHTLADFAAPWLI